MTRTETPVEHVGRRELRDAIGHFATGVGVVTALGAGERPLGSTANAISSVSLDPPLVLVCLREESDTLAALLERERFAISLLRHDQQAHADRFARRHHDEAWAGVPHRTGIAGAPLIDDAVATLECALHDVADGGDHRIVVGRVLAVEHGDDHVAPLLFYRGSFAAMAHPAEATDRAAASAAPPAAGPADPVHRPATRAR